jgi:pimeloyl-ACP methyl ester carboxylesterase
MRSSHSLDAIAVTFDDERLVADAGLIAPATLAQHLGLRELFDDHVDLGEAPGRANVGHKAMTVIHSALAGGDSIDDCDALRAGATQAVLGHGVLARDEWLANGPGNVQETVAGLILGPGCDSAPWIAKWNASPKESLALPYACLVGRDDITGRLGEITCPAIVFHGDADQSISMENAERLRDGLKGCEQLVVVAGAPHASNLSHPEQVNGPLRSFLLEHA